ncbi:MAG TPA: DUF4410 domain-containing protein [Pyrinomonadaceae bacterium]|nr:DUF4410 domain-containing protein [Pyrinomonadaceae bacterium]
MKDLKTKFALSLIIGLLLAFTSFAQNEKNGNTATQTKQTIEVKKFEIKQGVEFPATAVDVMMAEIVDELKKTNIFGQVLIDAPAEPAKTDKAEGEAKPEPTTEPVAKTEPNLVLTGTITKYEPGNRAARYLIGFGAGKTKVAALITITDKATGKVVLEKTVDGKVIIGLFGGDSNGATRGLAKEVAIVTKKSIK